MRDFARQLIAWHASHGRHDMPWQKTRDPYRVWLSEIMLQQTQVATVIPYYQRFLERFPTIESLAAAPIESVMGLWSGLGYYARARNLHACAKAVVQGYEGQFPQDPVDISQLPGIGRSTANSIAAFCFGMQSPIMDGNVKRVMTRHFGIEGFPGQPAIEKRLWSLAESLVPRNHVDIYNQAQMDLGSLVCTRSKPKCTDCPVKATCIALRDGRVAELPTRKPKRAVPEREATLLMLVKDGRVMLEQRPPSGIWGGLLSLPELPAGEDASGFAKAKLGWGTRKWDSLPSLTHAFTHFRLHISVLRADVTATNGVMENSQRWLAPGELADAPLPAPVRTILSAAFA